MHNSVSHILQALLLPAILQVGGNALEFNDGLGQAKSWSTNFTHLQRFKRQFEVMPPAENPYAKPVAHALGATEKPKSKIYGLDRNTAGGRFAEGVKRGSNSRTDSSSKSGDVIVSLTGQDGSKVSKGKTYFDPIFDDIIPGIIGKTGGSLIDFAASSTGTDQLLIIPAEFIGTAIGLQVGGGMMRAKVAHDGVKTAACVFGIERLIGVGRNRDKGEDLPIIKQFDDIIRGDNNKNITDEVFDMITGPGFYPPSMLATMYSEAFKGIQGVADNYISKMDMAKMDAEAIEQAIEASKKKS